jgi:hypothetical protein
MNGAARIHVRRGGRDAAAARSPHERVELP